MVRHVTPHGVAKLLCRHCSNAGYTPGSGIDSASDHSGANYGPSLSDHSNSEVQPPKPAPAIVVEDSGQTPSARESLRTLQDRLEFICKFIEAADCGNLPFTVSPSSRGDLEATIRAVMDWIDVVPPRSSLDTQEKIEEVDRHLEEIVDKCKGAEMP